MRPEASGGVAVESLAPGGPASNSGLGVGDLLTAIDGKPVSHPQQVRDEIASKQVGQSVIIDGLREGVPFRVTITTTPFPR
jgi:putative serine protease PepD